MKKVCILMAAYQGERYIAQQLDTIEKQSYRDWDLYINDDGSTDATGQILARFADRNKGKVFICRNESGRHGATANFIDLLTKVPEYEWYVFCDQDDVWPTDRLAKMLQHAPQGEDARKKPCVVYGRAEVVNEKLERIAESIEECMKIQLIRGKEQEQCLFSTYVYGMSMMFNHPLRVMIPSDPEGIMYHDAYVSMICAYFGTFVYLDDCVTKYRQHGGNESGGAGYFWSDIRKRLRNFRGLMGRMKAYKENILRQIHTFYDQFSGKMTESQRKKVQDAIGVLEHRGAVYRLINARKRHYFGYKGCGRFVPVLFLVG